MTRKQHQTTRWFYGMPLINGLVYRSSAVILRFLARTIWRFRVKGLENIPKTEPFLLLPNHSNILDPFWVGTFIDRGIKSMGSATVLRIPILGRYLRYMGGFAKMKYTKDKKAMENLQAEFDKGYPILLFPEGNRCWNGQTASMLPGVGRLIKRLNCKVVYVRLNSAYFVKPRWATWPRWVPNEITYDGPYTYTEDQTPEEITADVQSKLDLTSHLKTPARKGGFRMAHGLPYYLWACPNCFALEALKVQQDDGNAVHCSACDSTWRINVECVLTGKSTLTVAEAFKKIDQHFVGPPVANAAEFEKTGVALNSPQGELHFIPHGKQKPEQVASGSVQIHTSGFRIVGPDTNTWTTSFKDIHAISVEMSNLLHFRIDGALYRINIPGESPLKWDHFLRKWRLHSVGAEQR